MNLDSAVSIAVSILGALLLAACHNKSRELARFDFVLDLG
jgi:hypothetical protein